MENPYSDNLLQQNRLNIKDKITRHPNLYDINDPNIIPDNQINKIMSAFNKSKKPVSKSKKPTSNNNNNNEYINPQPKQSVSIKPEPKQSVSIKPEPKQSVFKKLAAKPQRNIFIDMYNYRNKLLENKLSLLPKKFDYIEQDNDFREAMMILNKEYKINSDDVNKIKFISFSEFKSKLLLSRINEDLSLKFFFSKNKDYLYKIINKLYFNKNVGRKYDIDNFQKSRLSPIIEGKKKYGGSMLEPEGETFLSILSILDRKHDFNEGVNADITKYIENEGIKFINSKITPPQLTDILNSFKNNKNYEEDILINTINHMIGNPPYTPYLTDSNKLTSFAFIDVNDTMDKLNIAYKTPNTLDEDINGINATNIFEKLIEHISKFFKYDITTNPQDKYKYIFDTDVKLHSKFKTITDKKRFHNNIYDKIGEQLYPFENAFDPHVSNNITINSSNINTFREITKTNFNYDIPVPPLLTPNKTDYMYAIKNNVNNYLGFQIVQHETTDTYIPCIIFKKYNEAKMREFAKFKTLFDGVGTPPISSFLKISNKTNPAIIDYNVCVLADKVGSSVQFYIDSILNDTNKYAYIKYSCSSFNNIPILKEYIKKLIEIYNTGINHKTDFDNLLSDKDAGFITKPNPGKIIIHFIIGYLYYCNDKNQITDSKAIIKEIIEILFDLKKAGDWGQALFCSEYNKKENINKKDCFFVTGDKLAAVRSLLCTNVKTILPVDYKIISGVNTDKKRSIITLYRNRFALTFNGLIDYIIKSIIPLKAFNIFHYDNLAPEFFMEYNYLTTAPIPPGKLNKNDEIITDTNFNYDTFNIFINYLKYQLQIYLYIYTITNLNLNIDNKSISDEIEQIDYNEYIAKETETINLISAINNPVVGRSIVDDYRDIKNHNLPNFNAFNMFYLFRLNNYSLYKFQQKYLSNNPNAIAEQQELFIELETNLNEYINKKDKFKKVFELFNKDFNKFVLELSNSVSNSQQKLINIADLYQSYSLLLCDDKFYNNNYSADLKESIIGEPSKTAIKRIIDSNNKEIIDFYYTFSGFYLDTTKFKHIAKDFITTNIVNLTKEKNELEEIQGKLDKLGNYLTRSDIDSNKNGKNLVIWFKSEIRGDPSDIAPFLDYIKYCIEEYWKRYPYENFTKWQPPMIPLTPEQIQLNEYYEKFIEDKNDLYNELYHYFTVIYSQLFFNFDNSKISAATDVQKKEIQEILLDLYADESVKHIYGHVKNFMIFYNEIYDKIIARLSKIENTLELNRNDLIKTEAAIAAAIAASAASDKKRKHQSPPVVDIADIMADAVEDGDAVVDVAAVDAIGDTAMADAVAARGRIDDANTARISKRIRGNELPDYENLSGSVKDKAKSDIKNLFNKLRGGKNEFIYDMDTFKDTINDTMIFASFLKKTPVKQLQNIRNRKPDDILSDIGFIVYIIDFFEKVILNRTPDIFLNINKYYSNVNSELIKHIYKFRYGYYFDTDYILIPIIYKYLKFIVKNKEAFISNKDESLFTYNKIYEQKYKNRIGNILYNLDVLFNIIKDTPINNKEKENALKNIAIGPSAATSASSGRGRGRGRGRGAATSASSGRGAPSSGRGAPSSGRGAPSSGPTGASSSGPVGLGRGLGRGRGRGRGSASSGRGRGAVPFSAVPIAVPFSAVPIAVPSGVASSGVASSGIASTGVKRGPGRPKKTT
jgi:hypothetical protein